jgi:hypothetical protein
LGDVTILSGNVSVPLLGRYQPLWAIRALFSGTAILPILARR